MWKVYGCYPKTSEDVVVKAMMDAYQKGVDIISVSIGSNNGWPESPMAVAAQRITEKGVPGTKDESSCMQTLKVLTLLPF